MRQVIPGTPEARRPDKVGFSKQLQQEYLKSPIQIALTVGSLLLALYVTFTFLNWSVFQATFTGDGQENCSRDGACWTFIAARFNQFMYGFYPREEQWRINVVAVALLVGFFWLVKKDLPYKNYVALIMVFGLPVIGGFLIHGGFGLPVVPTSKWGGLTLTLIIALTAIAISLPLGSMLALARRSKMPVISALAVMFIEVVRAVPLISILFMASVLLPIFLPQGMSVDKLLRALIGVALFASAYMAEVVRGGLQAVPEGQAEAASALGLSHNQAMMLFILPQALRIAIPGIANTFIAIFKDTSLVIIIGLFDLLGMINAGVNDPRWIGMELEGFVFAGAVYWIFCSAISRFSRKVERDSNFGH